MVKETILFFLMSNVRRLQYDSRLVVEKYIGANDEVRQRLVKLVMLNDFSKELLHDPKLIDYFLWVLDQHPEAEYIVLLLLVDITSVSGQAIEQLYELAGMYIDKLLQKPPEVQHAIVWFIGNVAGESSEWSKGLIESSVIQYLCAYVLSIQDNVEYYNITTWVISILFQQVDSISKQDAQNALDYFQMILELKRDELLDDVFYTIYMICNFQPDFIEVVLGTLDFQVVIDQLTDKNIRRIRQAFMLCSHLVYASVDAAQILVEVGILEQIKALIDKYPDMTEKIYHFLSNMACDKHSVVQKIIEKDFPIVALSNYANASNTRRHEIVWLLVNVCLLCEKSFLQQMIHQDIFRCFIDFMQKVSPDDQKFRKAIQTCLKRFFKDVEGSRQEFEDVFLELNPPLEL